MRFAFYGRVSTEDNQDPEASRNWQIARARGLIEHRTFGTCGSASSGCPGAVQGSGR
jgi:hypothetical protein